MIEISTIDGIVVGGGREGGKEMIGVEGDTNEVLILENYLDYNSDNNTWY